LIIYNSSGEVPAEQGKLSVAFIEVKIPEGAYIYANPKGPGTGKATELVVEKNRFVATWEARYPEGEHYMAPGDTGHVFIYRKEVRFPVAFTLKDKVTDRNFKLKVNVSILMCTSDACFPVEKKVDIPVKVKKGILDNNSAMMENIKGFLSFNKSTIPFTANRKTEGEIKNTGSAIFDSIKFTPRYEKAEVSGLLEAIIFGLLAGFILNFMPCVLPVVSLKIMSFVQNAGERRDVTAKQGLLFAAGILASFLVLAVLAAFSGYKWGALFQNRFFIIIMASFIFAMALSFLGVYTLAAPSAAGRIAAKARSMYPDAFIKGVVATLLATPCSGPFLGSTLAWALTQSPAFILTVFIAMGTGMALPYLLLSMNPSLLRFLPAPGDWMVMFERIMGFVLMFTVVYLAGILDDTSRMGLVLFILFISAGLWQFGKFGSIDREKWRRGISAAALVIIIAGGYLVSFRYFYKEKTPSHERIEFNTEKIMQNRDMGIITVIVFTAKWCPNCSLVEKLALEKQEVKNLFARENIDLMVADITFKNIQAESLMKRLGSSSIPFLAVFPPGDGFTSPVCLRDIYSAGDVVMSLEKAAKYIKLR
jgi:thiol:disulfide interchange protein DsbD